MQRSEDGISCGECGEKIRATESELRIRIKNSKSGNLYCNMACSAKAYSKSRVKSMRPEDFTYLAKRHEELQSTDSLRELIDILIGLDLSVDNINRELRSLIFKLERIRRCQK
jgi:hypothetical protein